MEQVASGLEGIVVAETKLSDVQGEAGRLIVAGDEIERLAGVVPFESVVARVLPGLDLGRGRRRAWEVLDVPRRSDAIDAMNALRASIARLEGDDPELVIGATAVLAAAWVQKAQGREPLAPDASLGHAADYLRMLSGSTRAPLAAAMDAYFVTVMDHGMNASTFTARVIASTGADLVSAVTGAIGALKGPLHGGAPGPVLDMLDAIGSPARADSWISAELAAGRRIMGMGHRVYRVRDPRAAVLERQIHALERAGEGSALASKLALARATERAAERILGARHPDRALRANVEFYTAVLLDALGVPRSAFTLTFAAARVAGWCAHVAEQRAVGRLIRPASRYVGPMPA